MSRRSRLNTNNCRSGDHRVIDDKTGFVISSRDAVQDYGGMITHYKNVDGPPPDQVPAKVTVKRPLNFTRPWVAPRYAPAADTYDYGYAYNSNIFPSNNPAIQGALNPILIELQSRDEETWSQVVKVWSADLDQYVNPTWNPHIKFLESTLPCTFGPQPGEENTDPTFDL